MSSLKLKTPGGGSVSFNATDTVSDVTLTVPASNASILTDAAAISSSLMPAGSVLQVLQAVKTDTFTTTSTTYVDITGLTVNITPSSTSSKILVMYNTNCSTAGDVAHGYINIFRNGTELVNVTSASNREGGMNVFNTESRQQPSVSGFYLDSPSSTSSLTYQIRVKSSNGSTMYVNRSARDTDNNQYDGRSISTVTVMEIAG